MAAKSNATCARQEILNEQRVSRQTFKDAAHAFILHERRQIEIEEQNFFPMAQSALTSCRLGRPSWQAERREHVAPHTRAAKSSRAERGSASSKGRELIQEQEILSEESDHRLLRPADDRKTAFAADTAAGVQNIGGIGKTSVASRSLMAKTSPSSRQKT
jgi:hypothetical protein